MSFHTLLIAGHLGRDPEMRYSPTGEPVTTFNLAANRPLNSPDGQPTKETIWFRVSTWDKTAENCNLFLHKGSLVLVEGRLVCDPQTGGPRIFAHKDGTPGAAFEVNASTVRFLSGQESPEPTKEGGQNSTDPRYGDIPF